MRIPFAPLTKLRKLRNIIRAPRLNSENDLRQTEKTGGLIIEHDAACGLGDRIGYYLGHCALARCWNMEVYANWIRPDIHELGHRPLELINFPKNLHFEKDPTSENFDYHVAAPRLRDLRFYKSDWYHGLDLVPELQYAMWRSWSKNFRNTISREDYLQSWQEVAEEITPNFDPKYPDKPFLGLHVRRGNKSHPNLPLVDQETKLILKRAIKQCPTWVIFSDCEEAYSLYQNFICENGGEVLSLPEESEPIKQTIREFFWLTRANGVVQSVGEQGRYGGFSSFSFFPCLIAKTPLIACIPLQEVGPTRYQYFAKVNLGQRLDNIFYNHEVDEFLAQAAKSHSPVAI